MTAIKNKPCIRPKVLPFVRGAILYILGKRNPSEPRSGQLRGGCKRGVRS